MNGVHDMGGMTCFGPVIREENEPIFHAPWERRVFAMTLGGGVLACFDEARRALEHMDPAHYLASSYYEHWLAFLETLVVEKEILTQEELVTGVAQNMGRGTRTPLSPDQAVALIRQGTPFQRYSGRLTPRFNLGDHVTARNIHPSNHTRLPRYVRGRRGIISRMHGTFVYPDTIAHRLGEQPQPLYSVRFTARELWGPTSARRDHLYIDLWEDYLEPASVPVTKTKTTKAVKKASARTAQSARTETKTTARSQRRRKTEDRRQKGKKTGRIR
jgi:nitrile hydratase subunit beta